MYAEPIEAALIGRGMSWRAFSGHLVGLLSRDTPTGTLWHSSTPAAVPSATPQQIGDTLAAWAK